ncbi:glycosyltransferase involved in cell wall biosynthesis [Rhizobium sp. BK212]|uniref:glycosyltransferase family 4 protein n=1 Tax=Rhizobium sp. BK212 TaxID=2587074 RepID=UPI0003F890ED|nr:glycosyltransferase family 4 protein [Rhizobium sp. BK212]MBB4218725.1 glycosyltransferase involved in cell wall biosynthesis [Rhizobium sp. BK212]
MKIAQIAPLPESVPPKLYGGTERIVSYLTEELVSQGHDVTLFASGDSVIDARLVSCADVALRLNPAVKDQLPHQIVMLEEIRCRAHEFDVLHFHIDLLHFPLIRNFADRTLTTLHGRLDLPDLKPFYQTFADVPVVSISNDQRRPMPPVHWAGTVYHGLPTGLLPFTEKPKGDYLAFLGRISPEKRPDRAIEIAAKVGMQLKIAAKIDNADMAYWETVIEPMMKRHSNVEFIGEIDEHQKATFLGNAGALLFPIDWPEPFGLVMIEAMACGTPVVAFGCGSVPEVIDNGVSGILVDSVTDAAENVEWALRMDRHKVRATFEKRFTAERMAYDYLDLYRSLPGVRSKVAPVRRSNGQPLDLQLVV